MVSYAVEVSSQPPRPVAVVSWETSWQAFPAQWRDHLDEVYAWLRQSGTAGGAHVLRYQDGPGPGPGARPGGGGGRGGVPARGAGAAGRAARRAGRRDHPPRAVFGPRRGPSGRAELVCRARARAHRRAVGDLRGLARGSGHAGDRYLLPAGGPVRVTAARKTLTASRGGESCRTGG